MGDAIFTRRFSLEEKIPFYELSINHTTIDATLTNFPVMVRTTSTNYNMSLLTNDNVYFTDESKTLLDFEVEYSTTNERVYHVKLPSISSSTATKFRLYFDGSGYSNGLNETNVWSNGYIFVSHMNSNFDDVTSNGLTGTNFNSTLVNGPYGQARYFNGNAHIRYGNPSYVSGLSQWNAVSFVNTTQSTAGLVFGKHSGGTDGEWYLANVNTMMVNNSFSRVNIAPSSTIRNGQWNTISLNYNGSQLRSFVNNNLSGSANQSGTIKNTNHELSTGTIVPAVSHNYWELTGTIKENRMSNVSRTDAWIKAEYYTLFNTMINNVTLTEE